jgi:hypothetical protein
LKERLTQGEIMKISQLISNLEKIQKEKGDLTVYGSGWNGASSVYEVESGGLGVCTARSLQIRASDDEVCFIDC